MSGKYIWQTSAVFTPASGPSLQHMSHVVHSHSNSLPLCAGSDVAQGSFGHDPVRSDQFAVALALARVGQVVLLCVLAPNITRAVLRTRFVRSIASLVHV